MMSDWDDNDLRMMKYMKERCAEIGRALNGSRVGGKNKGTHFGIVGYQSTHNVGRRRDGQRAVDQRCQ